MPGPATAQGYRLAPGYGAEPGYGAPDGYAPGTVPPGFAEPRERPGGAPSRLTAPLRRDDRRRGRRRHGAGGGRGPFGGVPVLAVTAIVASAAVVAAAVGISRVFTTSPVADTAAVNMNCTLIVPANPLTAAGLATPYQLTATNPADGPCDEANQTQTAFVQGAVLDPATGGISVYNPLVVDAGSQPAIAPVVPSLPAGAVVALWFGFNGGTLTLAGPDQVPSASTSPSASAATGSVSSPTSPSAAAQAGGTGTPSPSGSGTQTGTATPATTPGSAGSPSPSGAQSAAATPAGTPTGSGSQPGTPAATGTPTATGSAPASQAAAAAAPRAGVQDVAAAPQPPAGQATTWFNATLTSATGVRTYHHHHLRPSPSPSGTASAVPSPTGSASPSGTAVMSPAPTTTGSPSAPPTNPADGPAASGNPDATLQQANCVAGEETGGQFSPFTQVGACNAVAFFAAANAAVRAGKLKVPAPGTAKDGKACLTTRSFALIDQDQSDNVTTEYLVSPGGQTAQDTAANRQALGAGAGTLFNGSDNGLLDLFVDPALGCSPWQVPNLADGGAPAPALPLDELQAAAYTGGRNQPIAALVPLNDPMTLDNNGNFSTDKTNTYRSLVDMAPLPAGQSPRQYCSDMERIQGQRLQQDVNLLLAGPSPDPAAANTLFTFLAMRLQQSYGNLNCGAFGIRNQVTTTADGNGVVVAACFARQFAPVTPGPGNPMAGHRTCPATTGGQAGGAGSPSASPSPTHSRGYHGGGYRDRHSSHSHHM